METKIKELNYETLKVHWHKLDNKEKQEIKIEINKGNPKDYKHLFKTNETPRNEIEEFTHKQLNNCHATLHDFLLRYLVNNTEENFSKNIEEIPKTDLSERLNKSYFSPTCYTIINFNWHSKKLEVEDLISKNNKVVELIYTWIFYRNIREKLCLPPPVIKLILSSHEGFIEEYHKFNKQKNIIDNWLKSNEIST